MEQNNFEKNVQQKLDELKIPPSDSVWTNVEKRIRKKDNGRKLVFIFLFLILILLSGGYWLFNSVKNNHQTQQQMSNIVKTETNSKAANKHDSSSEKSKITSGNISGKNRSETASAQKTKSIQANSQHRFEKKTVQKKGKSVVSTSNSQSDYSKLTNNKDSQFTGNNVSKLAEKKTGITEIKNTTDTTTIPSNIQNKVIADSFSDELKTEKTIENLMAKKDLFIKRTSKKRWIFGITLSGGVSLIGNDILQRNYPSLDMSAGAPGGNSSYYYNPSPIKNSSAFIAGVFLEKNISRRDKISFGIYYQYFSFTNKIGSRIDSVSSYSQYLSSNNLYSSSNSSHLYRNNFHYLEVPVSIKFKINKSKSLPLYSAAGINISELISSNALQFQSIPGIYYDDNAMFNKTNFGFHTGFSAMFFAQEKYPLTVGPYFYYDATSVANKGLYQKKHFSFIGIQAEILFNKK